MAVVEHRLILMERMERRRVLDPTAHWVVLALAPRLRVVLSEDMGAQVADRVEEHHRLVA